MVIYGSNSAQSQYWVGRGRGQCVMSYFLFNIMFIIGQELTISPLVIGILTINLFVVVYSAIHKELMRVMSRNNVRKFSCCDRLVSQIGFENENRNRFEGGGVRGFGFWFGLVPPSMCNVISYLYPHR